MVIRPTKLSGVFEIEAELKKDERGFFARTFCAQAFADAGLETPVAQMALSHNLKKGTLRGLHVIPEDIGEAKLVRCVRGAAYDVAADLRRGSQTFGQWIARELSADNYLALFLPKGVAHGFLTLTDTTELAYQFSEFHRPGVETGIRWDDPDIAVDWPFDPEVMSARDRDLPFLAQTDFRP